MAGLVAMTVPVTGWADENREQLEGRIAVLERQVEEAYREASMFRRADMKWHLAGYADAGYTATNKGGGTDSFDGPTFAPIFHFMYQDWLFFESEVKLKPGGHDLVTVEYAAINAIVHDYAVLKVGKFLSPIGQFMERLHPSWINKLPSAPAGFSHGEVQPETDIGLQVRGGFPLGDMLANYVLYVGNGPQEGEVDDNDDGHSHGIQHRGRSADRDNKAVGGRFGLLPIDHLEFGVSFLWKDKLDVTEGHRSGTPTYRLWGADVAYTRGPWDVRMEYLDTRLDKLDDSGHAGKSEQTAWYVQAAYRLGHWEPVLRYGEFEEKGTIFHDEKEKRWTTGLNYVFASSVIGKIAVERRSFDHGEDHERVMMELTFGF